MPARRCARTSRVCGSAHRLSRSIPGTRTGLRGLLAIGWEDPWTAKPRLMATSSTKARLRQSFLLLFLELKLTSTLETSLPEVNVEMHEKPESVSCRMSDSAPRYTLIILLGGVIAAGACLWGLLHLVGLL